MISDEERREVAEKLRERTKKPMGKSMQRMFTETLGMYARNICWRNPDKATNRWDVIVSYLADLIDRPTCEMGDGAFFNGRNEYGAVCSNCECAFEDAEEARTWHYCPNCGAEVVD